MGIKSKNLPVCRIFQRFHPESLGNVCLHVHTATMVRKKSSARPTIREGLSKGLQPLLSYGLPLVIGTVHEKSGLQIVRRGGAVLRGLDVIEARLDCLGAISLPDDWPLPVIATARHPDEGGSGGLSSSIRRSMLSEAIPWASAIDVELRSAKALAPVIAEAHQHGRTVILSHHDFKKTPEFKTLRTLAAKAAEEGADLFKIATQLNDRRDLITLIEFQNSVSPVPVAAMGMGPAGRFSRLVLGGFGAPLCYGWLGKPQVSGQWPASELRALFNGVLPA
jgi:3-dehydroquinate dehydratase-1